jgi:hypothetical protein
MENRGVAQFWDSLAVTFSTDTIYKQNFMMSFRGGAPQSSPVIGQQYHTEPKEGRVHINLMGGPVMDMPSIDQGYLPQQTQYGGGQQQQQYHGLL